MRLTDAQLKIEWLKCADSPAYFIHEYCWIYNATERRWLPFHLWPAQVYVLGELLTRREIAALKARQLGLTWLVLCYCLWLMLFHPAAAILLFSKRDDEAEELLSRLKGIYDYLPGWMRARRVLKNSDHYWLLSNGSSAKAFPTTGGRSYTGTVVVADEADFMPDLGKLMDATKPTIDAGGQFIAISTSDKDSPNSTFKRLYLAAKKGLNSFFGLFLPWWARPERDKAWYAEQLAYYESRDDTLDKLWQEYPATDMEALAPNSLNKRIPPKWLARHYKELKWLALEDLPMNAPAIPGLRVYRVPKPGRRYVIGADPAEGNPTSDDSALDVLDYITGEQVATLAGKFEMSTFASHIDMVGNWYNRAGVMVERNNHGHAVLMWLRDHSRLTRLFGLDFKEGWNTNGPGKADMYATTATAYRDGDVSLYDYDTYLQLQSIEGATLKAPEGEFDDKATAHGLAQVARAKRGRPGSQSNYMESDA
jgi:hypothetical protein